MDDEAAVMQPKDSMPPAPRELRPDQNEGTLPLSMDPAWGALVGTFLLASCLAGPIGLAMALVALVVMDVLLRRTRLRRGSSSQEEAQFAARFRKLEDGILRDGQQ